MNGTENKLWAIVLHQGDDVAVIAAEGKAGQICSIKGEGLAETLILATDVPFAHKVSLRAMRAGETVTKYGCPIAQISSDTAAGSHIHTHNVQGVRATLRGGQT